MRALVLAVAVGGSWFAGCDPGPGRWVVRPDDPAYQSAADRWGPCIGAAAGVEPFGGTVVLRFEPFPCERWPGDTALCAGRAGNLGSVEVLRFEDPERSALPHELAHDALCRVGGDCREPAAEALVVAAAACAAVAP